MAEPYPFTIDQFYKFIGEKKLAAAKCNDCGLQNLPPRPICARCLSTNLRWVELDTRGKVVTYTVTHVAPKQFESIAPYAFGIVELEDGARLPGMIRDVDFGDLKIGMEVEMDFDTTPSTEWPYWPRYFFRPVKKP